MKRRCTLGEGIFEVANHTLLSLLVLVTIYPLLYVLFASVSESASLMKHSGLLLWPQGFSWAAYRSVFNNPMILASYRNTLIYTVLGTAINILLTSLGAYVLTRKDLRLRRFLTLFCLFPMFFSGGLIPFYLTVKSLRLFNTIWAILLPSAINVFNLIVMRTYFMGIPDSMVEAAKIDGGTDYYILFRIIVPLALPILAVMLLFYGVGNWNAWFNAMIFLRDREMYPLQLILREILIASDTDSMTAAAASMDQEALAQTIKYAAIVVATLPILCVYPFLQKYFVNGIMVGALKE